MFSAIPYTKYTNKLHFYNIIIKKIRIFSFDVKKKKVWNFNINLRLYFSVLNVLIKILKTTFVQSRIMPRIIKNLNGIQIKRHF